MPGLIPETPDEQRRFEAAKERRARRLEEREQEARQRERAGAGDVTRVR